MKVLIALALVVASAASVEVWQGTFSFPGLQPGTWLAHNIPINITVDTNASTATVEWIWQELSNGEQCVPKKEPQLKVSTQGQQWFARGTGKDPQYYSLEANLTNDNTLLDGVIYSGTWPGTKEGSFSAKKNAPRSSWQCSPKPTPRPAPKPTPPPTPKQKQQSPVWPAPASYTTGNANLTLASDFQFKFASSKTPATLLDVFSRYESLARPHRSAKTASNTGNLHQLVVSITDTNEAPPQQGTNESYTLNIDASGSASLNAVTVYGAMRGMETFSQLVRYQFSTSTYFIANVPLLIKDEPRFVHRGFMVDTARHFQTLGMLKRLIDSLSYAKMNVLHWHAVDDQSFPLQVDSFPKLQEQGAYSAGERYSRLDVADIVEYARLRGVRVMLEIDTPSHTACWCRGYGDKVCPPKPCKDGLTRTPLDPSTNSTFDMVQQVLQELSAQFPEELLHVGQDEVDVGCWTAAQNPTIGAWQQQRGFDETQGDQAYVYAANRIEDGVRSLKKRAVQWWPGLCLGVPTGGRSCGKPTGFCPCRGVVPGNGEKDPALRGLDPDTVLLLWDGNSRWSGKGRTDLNDTVAQVVKAGYSVIQSSGWYLNAGSLRTTWEQMYANEPMAGITDPQEQARVLGGEAAAWGELIDGSVLLNTVWPRTAAVAERLWSPRSVDNPTEAKPRLAAFRCLLLERGVPAGTLDFTKTSYALAEAGQPPPRPGSCYTQ